MDGFKIGMSTVELNDLSWSTFRRELETLSLDSDSCALMEWRFCEELEERFNQLLDYFLQKPEIMREEVAGILAQLSIMEWNWCELEKYEWCAVVRDIQFKYLEEWAEWL
jgi:hypothetical protein